MLASYRNPLDPNHIPIYGSLQGPNILMRLKANAWVGVTAHKIGRHSNYLCYHNFRKRGITIKVDLDYKSHHYPGKSNLWFPKGLASLRRWRLLE